MIREAIALPLFAIAASAQQSAWGQCGGNNWTGATDCVDGYYCNVLNEWYYQCVPGGDPSSTTTAISTSADPTTIPTLTTVTTAPDTTTPTATTTTATASGYTVIPTLVSGQQWIRAVADPNYHLYLQAAPPGTPGPATLDDGDGAGQFSISANGQLVYYRGDSLPPLYMQVEDPTSSSPADPEGKRLKATFAETENIIGIFEWQGDTLTWDGSDAAVPRSNNAAFLVCEDQTVWINLGAYGYMTPEGCADQTIHGYGASVADY